MHSFTPAYLERLAITPSLMNLASAIQEYRGKQALFYEKKPEILEALRQVAFIESVESSNRLENIEVGPYTLQAIVQDNAPPNPTSRDQSELAGYRYALDMIHKHHANMVFSVSLLRQLHGYLMRHTPAGGGNFKINANNIVEKNAEGEIVSIRFRTVPPHMTEDAMARLHEGFEAASAASVWNPLLLIALYVHDFLCIHPFSDGNGRMARLITVLLLYRYGYEVGRYISLEKIIEETKFSYYESLGKADAGWAEGRHRHAFFTEYLLGTILLAYRRLETKVMETGGGYGVKTELVRRAIEGFQGEFSKTELEKACPTVSRAMIRHVMRDMKEAGMLQLMGKGKASRWKKAV